MHTSGVARKIQNKTMFGRVSPAEHRFINYSVRWFGVMAKIALQKRDL